MGSLGVFYPGNLVWVGRFLEHRFVFGCLAAYLGGVGLMRLLSKRWLKFLVGFASLLVALVWSAALQGCASCRPSRSLLTPRQSRQHMRNALIRREVRRAADVRDPVCAPAPDPRPRQ